MSPSLPAGQSVFRHLNIDTRTCREVAPALVDAGRSKLVIEALTRHPSLEGEAPLPNLLQWSRNGLALLL